MAVLPWGATEAHNYHLAHGTDILVATAYAERAAAGAFGRGAGVVVLPGIPFGNNGQQMDQVATVHLRTTTAYAILQDVCLSLTKQGIDRLVIVNGHGGNEFKPLIRDLEAEFGILVVQVHVFQLVPKVKGEVFVNPGNHAGESETSIMMYLFPGLVELEHAGDGRTVPFAVKGLDQAGVWTPRPWAKSQPDTGAGDPRGATAAKGEKVFRAGVEALEELLVSLAGARKGELPYV